MHSRLYRRVLNQHHWVTNCAAFTSLYNDTGLVGILASADSGRAGASVEVIVNELQVSHLASHPTGAHTQYFCGKHGPWKSLLQLS